MMIKCFQQRNNIKERKRSMRKTSEWHSSSSRECVCVCVRWDVSNRHKTEWRKMVYERRVNDLYFMPFFFIRTLLSSRIYVRSYVLLVLPLVHLFGSVSWTVGCSLAALILITFSLAYLLRQWSLPNPNLNSNINLLASNKKKRIKYFEVASPKTER